MWPTVGLELQKIDGFNVASENMFCIQYSSSLVPQHLILLLKLYDMIVCADSGSLQCR